MPRSILRPRPLRLLLLASVALLASCGDDDSSCSTGSSVAVQVAVDSAVWLYRSGDRLLKGALDPYDQTRYTAYAGGWHPWSSVSAPRALLAGLEGQVWVRGRLGLPDTNLYFEVDSFRLPAGRTDTAGIRIDFRAVSPQWSPADSSTYWSLRGFATCSLPMDADLSRETSYSCVLDAVGDDGAVLRARLQVSRYEYEYDCGGRDYAVASD